MVYECCSTREASWAQRGPLRAPAGSLKSWPMAETTALGEEGRGGKPPEAGKAEGVQTGRAAVQVRWELSPQART